jgi:hypothetical protein
MRPMQLRLPVFRPAQLLVLCANSYSRLAFCAQNFALCSCHSRCPDTCICPSTLQALEETGTPRSLFRDFELLKQVGAYGCSLVFHGVHFW